MKQQLLSDIKSKLSALGIPVQTGNGADITLTAEFLDAEWSTGKKKVSYEASVFADEQSNVVYMYEKTAEIGQGVSFGAESESFSQSGKTLSRKIKSVQYGPDGKAFEVELDLGAISKTVKETAFQYGWQFKTVLSKMKAMYPAGYVSGSTLPPVLQAENASLARFCSNCGEQLISGSKFCSKCGSAATPPIAILEGQNDFINQKSEIPPRQEQSFSDPNGAFYSNDFRKNARKPAKASLGLVGFFVLTALALIFFLVGSVSVIGWVLGVAVIIGFFLLQRKLANRGYISLILGWVASFLLIFFIFALTSVDDSHNNTSDDASDNTIESSNTTSGQENAGQQHYLEQGYAISVYQTGINNYNYDAEIFSDNLELGCTIFEQMMVNEGSDFKEGDKVKEIRIKNFALTNGPQMGTFGGLELVPELNAEFYPRIENGDVIYNLEEYSKKYSGWTASLCFSFTIKDIATYTYPQNDNSTLSIAISFERAGISSDDLRFGCTYDVELTTMDGKKFVKHVETVPLQGDFLYDPNQATTETRVYDAMSGENFEAVS